MISSFGSVLVGIGILTTGICVADEPGKPDPQPLRQFDGSTAEDVSGPIPEQVILDQASYQNAWNRLGLKESPGSVDFAHEAVFLSTTRGSRITLRWRNEGEGRLRVSAISTRDIRPGLRYVFGVFSKNEWKQINGNP